MPSGKPSVPTHQNKTVMTKEQLKIVFFGTPEFAVASLDKIVADGFNVVGCVTMPDKPAGRGHKMYQSPVKEYAVAHNIPLLQPVNLKDEQFQAELRAMNADLFIVIAFRMLPAAVWQMPPLGTFNLHASLLPRYRGAAPINWAVMNGDTETGVTTFFLKHEIDTGDILRQERVEILPTDNVGHVHDKLMALGADLTLDTIRHIIAGDLTPIPQEQLLQGEEATPAPKIFKDTCRINWELPATRIHNHVRGLSPYPAAWSEIHDADNPGRPPLVAKIFATAVCEPVAPLRAGELFAENGHMWVGTASADCIEILELQPAGKKRMTAAEFLRGAHLPTHTILK